jgi:AcrR family transcriptional regulator
MDAVADHAGVSKATIYRWWPSKEMLALESLLVAWEAEQPPLRATGSLRGDLLALLRPWVRRAAVRPYARVIAALLVKAHCDPEFAQIWRQRFVAVRRQPARLLLTKAIAAGELPANTDVELTLDLLYGPLYHRLLHGHAPLTERVARDVVDATLAGVVRKA